MNADKQILIDIQNVSKSYQGKTVLNDINVQIRKGDVIAVIGSSGGGKSTFLRLLNGMETADTGKIVFEGENGRIVDMEISGGTAYKDPVYVIHGTRGSIVSADESRLKVKYMNPAIPLPQFEAQRGNPKGYGSGFAPTWVEDDLQVAPANGNDTYVIWRHLYEAIRNGKEFPIKFEEAREVVRVTELVRQGAIDNVRDHEF